MNVQYLTKQHIAFFSILCQQDACVMRLQKIIWIIPVAFVVSLTTTTRGCLHLATMEAEGEKELIEGDTLPIIRTRRCLVGADLR